jgi:hypothetical protein
VDGALKSDRVESEESGGLPGSVPVLSGRPGAAGPAVASRRRPRVRNRGSPGTEEAHGPQKQAGETVSSAGGKGRARPIRGGRSALGGLGGPVSAIPGRLSGRAWCR